MNIRDEEPRDEDAIRRVTERAFAALSHSNHMEAQIVDRLRHDGDLAVSLVAELGDEVAGHIAFSPIAIGGRHDRWFGLGPLSVDPDRQNHGIGSALVSHGLSRLQHQGAKGCAVLGSPAFYRRLGFRCDARLRYGNLPARLVQSLAFARARPAGELTYARAFELAR